MDFQQRSYPAQSASRLRNPSTSFLLSVTLSFVSNVVKRHVSPKHGSESVF